MNILGEFKIIKDHIYFRIVKKTRPWAIHTECLHKNKVWDKVKEYVKKGKKTVWYVITPVDMDFVQVETGCDLTKAEYEKVLVERYKWLEQNGQELQLHVHLRVKMNMYEDEDKKIEEEITNAYNWMKKNGFNPNKIVFGWWSYNKKAENTANQLGLEVSTRLDNYFIHDYDLLCLK